MTRAAHCETVSDRQFAIQPSNTNANRSAQLKTAIHSQARSAGVGRRLQYRSKLIESSHVLKSYWTFR